MGNFHFFPQAIGDGGQGWGNAVLYILASSKIRKKLLCDLCKSCMKMSGRKLQTLGGKLTTVGERLVTVGAVHLDGSQSSLLSENTEPGACSKQGMEHWRQKSGRVSSRGRVFRACRTIEGQRTSPITTSAHLCGPWLCNYYKSQ